MVKLFKKNVILNVSSHRELLKVFQTLLQFLTSLPSFNTYYNIQVCLQGGNVFLFNFAEIIKSLKYTMFHQKTEL